MCRLSSEIFVVAGGSGALATIGTFLKVHWDSIRDRKAFKAAKERERLSNDQFSDVQEMGQSD